MMKAEHHGGLLEFESVSWYGQPQVGNAAEKNGPSGAKFESCKVLPKALMNTESEGDVAPCIRSRKIEFIELNTMRGRIAI
jgi:hypothetical protein